MPFMRGSSMWALLVAIVMAFASSSFSSDEVLNSHRSTGTNLLQAKNSCCPVNFEFQNFTIITSQCQGPDYPATQCCNALVQFACPFVDELNDSSNCCASIMFSYIHIYGKYPPGLFASVCQGNKNGLDCPTNNSTSYPGTPGTISGSTATM